MQYLTNHRETATSPRVFSFSDPGIRRAIIAFAADLGDAQATEDYHSERVMDADDLWAEGWTQARYVLEAGEAQNRRPARF